MARTAQEVLEFVKLRELLRLRTTCAPGRRAVDALEPSMNRAPLESAFALIREASEWLRASHELGFGVGIAHGYATLGRIGFDGRFDYGAIGTVVNLAARLCADAKDEQILIDSKVQAAIEEAVGTEPAGELLLKGFARPVRAFNVSSVLAAPA